MIPIGTDLKLRRLPVVTTSLIVLNTMVYVADCLYIQDFYDVPVVLYFRYVFSVFMHADFGHLFWNMLYLWIFGSYLEDKIGSKKFIFYYFICEIGAGLFHALFDGEPSIGASGAVSGIMGIYLFRCHYSKIKTIVPVFIGFVKVNINAIWLMLYWIFLDVYDAFHTESNVANWAHIGGYVTGFVIGKVNNYWQTAKVEHLYDRAAESLRRKSGAAHAEKDLLTIINIDPDNVDAHLQLARYYAGHNQKKDRGKKYYLAAARMHYMKKQCAGTAGEIFLEYLNRYNEPQNPGLHLTYASTLSNAGKYFEASGILEPLLHANALQGAIGEKVYVHYIEFALKAELKDSAQYACDIFQKHFPASQQLKKARALISVHKAKGRQKLQIERATVPGRLSRIIDHIKDITSDPIYWILFLFFINLFQGILFITSVFLAFSLTCPLRQIGSFFGSIFGGSHTSEAETLREYNISQFMDKARKSERNGDFEDAIEYLKAVLEEDKKREHHLAVRYQMARLYHKKTHQPQEAIEEYQIIFKTAPKDHPFRRDAYWGIKELSLGTAAFS